MLASLGTIIFTYLRRELVFGAGIPFGALFVGFQIDSISLLWSPEFLGTMYHKWKAHPGRKMILISMIVVCTLLGVSVGPSSAYLMRPRLDYWPAGGTSFWINATSDLLSPRTISDSPALKTCAVDTGDPACPHGDWQLIGQEYHAFWPRLLPMGSMPLRINIPSHLALRTMTIFQRSTSDRYKDNQDNIWGSKYALATVPTSAIADGLAEVGRLWARAMAATPGSHFHFRRDVLFQTTAPQSTVYTRCSETIVDDPTDTDDLELRFPVLPVIKLPPGGGVDGTVLQKGFYSDNDTATVASIGSLLTPGTLPALTWIDDSVLLNRTNSSLLAVATFASTTNDTSALYCCSIDSRVMTVELQSTRNEYKLVNSAASEWEHGTVNTSLPKIMPSAAWTRYMNPNISGENATAFSQTASTAGMWNTNLTSSPSYFPVIMEGILTTMVANGIARTSYNTSMIATLKGSEPDNNQWLARG